MSEAAEERARHAASKQPLEVECGGGELRITIGISTLCFAVTRGDAWGNHGLTAFKVTDEEAFAEGILRELRREDETGATMVHRMLDAAAKQAVEQGSEGIEEQHDGDGCVDK